MLLPAWREDVGLAGLHAHSGPAPACECKCLGGRAVGIVPAQSWLGGQWGLGCMAGDSEPGRVSPSFPQSCVILGQLGWGLLFLLEQEEQARGWVPSWVPLILLGALLGHTSPATSDTFLFAPDLVSGSTKLPKPEFGECWNPVAGAPALPTPTPIGQRRLSPQQPGAEWTTGLAGAAAFSTPGAGHTPGPAAGQALPPQNTQLSHA